MGIICSICHKKQSGFLEDFSLSREHMEMRICANCHEHLRVIEKADKRSVAKSSIAYFNRLLALDMCPEARETINLLSANMKRNCRKNRRKQIQIHIRICRCQEKEFRMLHIIRKIQVM